MHLSELVRTSFIAATASVDQLKLAGYQALRVGHSLLSLSLSLSLSLTHTLTLEYPGQEMFHYVWVYNFHFQDVIELFASTPDPDYPRHSLLEQYQAQVGCY